MQKIRVERFGKNVVLSIPSPGGRFVFSQRAEGEGYDQAAREALAALMPGCVEGMPDVRPSFTIYTDRARRVMSLASEEAKDMGGNYVGTEHIALGLCREDSGVAAAAMKNIGVDVDRLRAAVKELLGSEKENTAESAAPLLSRIRSAETRIAALESAAELSNVNDLNIAALRKRVEFLEPSYKRAIAEEVQAGGRAVTEKTQ